MMTRQGRPTPNDRITPPAGNTDLSLSQLMMWHLPRDASNPYLPIRPRSGNNDIPRLQTHTRDSVITASLGTRWPEYQGWYNCLSSIFCVLLSHFHVQTSSVSRCQSGFQDIRETFCVFQFQYVRKRDKSPTLQKTVRHLTKERQKDTRHDIWNIFCTNYIHMIIIYLLFSLLLWPAAR